MTTRNDARGRPAPLNAVSARIAAHFGHLAGSREGPAHSFAPVQKRCSSFSSLMAAPWILPLWSAGQLNSAAQASATFFTNIGLNSTPSWEHDKAAATHLSAKDCALVADLQADMVRKNPEAIAEAREKLSELEAAPAGFAFPPADDPLWKVRAATAQPAPHARGAFSARGGPLGSSGFCHIGAQLFLSRQRALARVARVQRACAVPGPRLLRARASFSAARSGRPGPVPTLLGLTCPRRRKRFPPC